MKKSLSIYIHIPFCVQKCAYCDFLSAPATSEVQEQYFHMLMKEIGEKAHKYAEEYIVETIFIGGGTPTSVEVELLCKMLGVVKDCFTVNPKAEISMECNPGTADKENLQKYRAAGINRLSIGLQSTQEHLLKKLGRIHTFEQFLNTFSWAREAGFNNINIDLMSALPGQALEDYERTLEQVLELKPEHISAYSLIVEKGTPFYDMELNLPDEDTERMMYERTEEILSIKGYHRYEISNYALPGQECRHNQVYWERGEYLGLGLGASSMMRRPAEEWFVYDEKSEAAYPDLKISWPKSALGYASPEGIVEVRTKNNSNLVTYLKGDFSLEEKNVLNRREAMEEFFFLGLREMKGVSLVDFAKEYGEDTMEWFDDAIYESIREGLLVQDGVRIKLSPKGIDVSNYVFEKFLE